MGRLKLAELAQVAEIVAAVAVVVSLVYVGMEVRSNTSAIRGAAMQAIATTDAAALMAIAADGDLSEIIRVGNLNPNKLTEADAYRYHLYLRQFWLSFQNIFQQSNQIGIRTVGLTLPPLSPNYVAAGTSNLRNCVWWP